MSRDGRCPTAETLAQFSAGELQGRSLQACRQHVQGCPRCRAEAESLARLHALLQQAPIPAAPAGLAARLLAVLPSPGEVPRFPAAARTP
jgi:anti-sigma factor RsiW